MPRKSVFKGIAEAPIIYTNSINVRRTNFDIQIVVGVIEEATDSEIVTKAETVLYMSPQHGKAMAQALQNQIDKYEAMFGPIVVSPQPGMVDAGDDGDEEKGK